MDEDQEQPLHEGGDSSDDESDENLVDAVENVDDENSDDGEDEDSDDEGAGVFNRLIRQLRPRVDMDSVKTRPSKMTYDASLPTTHAYLGSDLEEYSGRTVLDDNSHVSMPLLQLPGVILTPGQTLPLHLFHQRNVAMIRSLLASNRTFGMLYDCQSRSGESLVLNLGTTAEIISCKDEQESGIENMKLKAIGRQRFKVIETRRQIDGVLIGGVKILEEKEISDSLEAARCRSLKKLRLSSSCDPSCHGETTDIWRRRRRQRLFFEARCTRWPAWVYEMYDSAMLINQIKSELRSWYEGSMKLDAVPSNAIDFSYWVACKLPLEDHQRIALLEIDSAVQRLRAELYLLKQCTVLRCRNCETHIGNKNDVFSMSLDGPMAAYVNPGGYVHETLTLYRAQNLNLIGKPSKENSWFPGYAWTILQCRRCSHHMGWKFTTDKKKLKPEKFWGLTRSALQTGVQDDIDGERMPLKM